VVVGTLTCGREKERKLLTENGGNFVDNLKEFFLSD
jgi:hypothetical protein